ncbi:hypothetical protein [Bacillus cereus]|nr:hypothetical protein [Bacillus cereus]EOO22135.1 hypothetical protein ICC_06540 [Bacillus cereus BAG1X1-1]EOO42457.1 hypothetical protein ICI_06505 [Bacillus cereus BAG1X2-1]
MTKLKESDLFAPVKSFLIKNGCSNIYGEVLGCDVLGIFKFLDKSKSLIG